MTAADRPIPDIGSSRRVPAHSPIMTGIARQFHVVSKLQYYAGFFFQDYDQLLFHLLWRVSKRTLRSISAIRHPAGSVPSWSWASMSMHEGDYIIPKRKFALMPASSSHIQSAALHIYSGMMDLAEMCSVQARGASSFVGHWCSAPLSPLPGCHQESEIETAVHISCPLISPISINCHSDRLLR